MASSASIKKGEEWYQISIGGRQGNDTRLGSILGPSFAAVDVPRVVEQLVDVYLEQRANGERFIDVVDRIGVDPFKARIYAAQNNAQEKKVAHG